MRGLGVMKRNFLLSLLLVVPSCAIAQATVRQQISMAKELVPTAKTITVMCNVTEVQPILKEMKAATVSYGMELSVFDVKTFPEMFTVFRSLSSKTAGILW